MAMNRVYVVFGQSAILGKLHCIVSAPGEEEAKRQATIKDEGTIFQGSFTAERALTITQLQQLVKDAKTCGNSLPETHIFGMRGEK